MRPEDSWRLMGLQQASKIFDLDLTVSKDLVQESWADSLARMRRHDCGPPILVTQKMVAAFDAEHDESCLSEC